MKQEFIESISQDGTFIENPRNVLIGKYRGYLMVLYKINRSVYEININASRDARSLNEMLSFLYKEIGSDKRVKECVYENCKIIITFRRKRNLSEQIVSMTDKIIDYLQSHRLNTGCAFCGRTDGINAYAMKKNVQFLCSDCYERCYEFIYNKKMKRSKLNKHLLDLDVNYASKSKGKSKEMSENTDKSAKKQSKKNSNKEIIQTTLGTGYMYSDSSKPKKKKNSRKKESDSSLSASYIQSDINKPIKETKKSKKEKEKARVEKELLRKEEESRKELKIRQAEEKKKKKKKEKVPSTPILKTKKNKKQVSERVISSRSQDYDIIDNDVQKIDERSPMLIFSTNSLASFFGCLIGVAVWVMAYELQSRFDSVDGVLEIAMLAIPAFALTFYSKYSKDQIEIKSMVASVILILAMVYFAYNLVVALSIRELSVSMGKNVSIINAFRGVRNFLNSHPENKDLYYKKMIGSYIWTVIVTAMMIYIIDYNSKKDIA